MARPRALLFEVNRDLWENALAGEEACRGYLVARRWPDGVACPRCGSTAVKKHGMMAWHWLCAECSPSGTNYRFSHLTGTIFENTNKPLRDWFRVIDLVAFTNNGITVRRVWRYMEFGSLKTAWSMCHRVRASLADEDFRKLMGLVEIEDQKARQRIRRKALRAGFAARQFHLSHD